MKKIVFAVAALALATTAAFADVIADRQAVMKENAKQVGTLVKMVKGEAPFDAAAVVAALTALNDNVQKIDVAASFPAGSDKGDTTASPKIWEDLAGFQAQVDKFKEVTAAAVASPAADLDALKAQVGTIGQTCGTCHEAFRVKKG
ncbi:cytochrome c [Aminobacter sp. NyZ550]|jgi:cytochrome c556|uniref:Cytochrome c556 n=2 Tax=Aminobacter TaxID=31988 RepID=A0AAC8YSG9_AMIAI|nr:MULTISPECIES: cytochrome c [Aminobacter]AMS43623.1 cytochrome C556 [Aminobacter aminovorans]MBA8909159.1 cytochrome c556 [Aminobacter ciceronei]MBA9022983.1 cytochrome c556 [Aminobacter ciceronei]MBB3705235.1 cytochrome c556 [Aminobacter aminovorans]QOF72819.1 cytochrome c [Aminobacter sp. SR38]